MDLDLFVPGRNALKTALSKMKPEEIRALIEEAEVEQRARDEHERNSRSDDLLGTIRWQEHLDVRQNQHYSSESPRIDGDILWVRIAGGRWDPYVKENYGVSVADSELDWRNLTVVGRMAPKFVAEQKGYESDYDEPVYDDRATD